MERVDSASFSTGAGECCVSGGRWNHVRRKGELTVSQRGDGGYRQKGLIRRFSRDKRHVFWGFAGTSPGMVQLEFFCREALEMGPVSRATIEPDSQDVLRRSAAPHSASCCTTPLPPRSDCASKRILAIQGFVTTCRDGERNICLLV